MKIFILFLFFQQSVPAFALNDAYVCSACQLVVGLAQEEEFQARLGTALKEKCGEKKLCHLAVDEFIAKIESGMAPVTVCGEERDLCPQECNLYPTWPVKLPPQPEDWPIERRKLVSRDDASTITQIFIDAVKGATRDDQRHISPVAEMAYTIFELLGTSQLGENQCHGNITCRAIALADYHLPFTDRDGDRFATADAPRLRGSHWRGTDCDDKRGNVYPGRSSSAYDDSVDHNCNSIFGRNETGSFEDIFCKGRQQRGLILLGDSATAHFHLPPQWLTAKGWNLDQFVPDALDELDFPMCSWGTGHVTPEECPLQASVPGVDGVLSIYSQLRERNRCNHNDFQNIGVNGARMTSSTQLVESLARSQVEDHPVLLYLSLIGNDVCNGHPGFEHMTSPDEFYMYAIQTLTALDELLPMNSHVVAVALVQGELLYNTMHALQHPTGCTYTEFYDFMNCLEENPCWGWLNSNATVRRETTLWSDSLDKVYQNISDTQGDSFKNFEFIFYSPNWLEMFEEYERASGNPKSDLIEAGDGFHPSQAGNALFAQVFFAWLEENHPDAVGPVNPHNAEIDALFFS